MCWGYNEDGELGDGTLNNSPVPGRGARDGRGSRGRSGIERIVRAHRDRIRQLLGFGSTGRPRQRPDRGRVDGPDCSDGCRRCGSTRSRFRAPLCGSCGRQRLVLGRELGRSGRQRSSGGASSNRWRSAASAPPYMSRPERSFTCVQLVDTTVTCWGAGDRGQLGNGTTSSVSGPQIVSGLTGVSDLTAGEFHACAVLADHSMRCWGANDFGQLGDGTRSDSTSPVVVSGLADVVEAAAGDRHTCARLDSGSTSCWGFGSLGRLGDGSSSDQLVPTTVSTITNVAAITVGGDHSCAAMGGGAVGCWGSNSNGQLGDNTTTFRTVPTPVSTVPNDFAVVDGGGSHTCAARAAATMCWGLNNNGPTRRRHAVAASDPGCRVGHRRFARARRRGALLWHRPGWWREVLG